MSFSRTRQVEVSMEVDLTCNPLASSTLAYFGRRSFFKSGRARSLRRCTVRMRSESPSSDSSSGPGTPPEHGPISNKGNETAPWNEPHTFHTLEMQRRFMNPSSESKDVPALREITRPHIESFNALWMDDPRLEARSVEMETGGLLNRSLPTLPRRVVIDAERGDRIESTSCN